MTTRDRAMEVLSAKLLVLLDRSHRRRLTSAETAECARLRASLDELKAMEAVAPTA